MRRSRNRESSRLPVDSTEAPAKVPGSPRLENQETRRPRGPGRRFRREMATKWDEAEFRSSEENSWRSSGQWPVVSAQWFRINNRRREQLTPCHWPLSLTLLSMCLGQGGHLFFVDLDLAGFLQ